MSADERSGKKATFVRVVHFPKPGKAQAPAAVVTTTHSLPGPESWEDRELVTEPYFIPEGGVRVTPPWPTQPSAPPINRRAPNSRDRRKKPRGKRKKGPEAALTPQRVAELSLHGHRLFELGKFEEARDVFQDLVGLKGPDSFPHTMLGTIYLALGDADRALALFQASLEIDPNDVAALVYRAEIRLNQGKLKPALADLHRAVDLAAPDDPFLERARRLLRVAGDLSRRARR